MFRGWSGCWPGAGVAPFATFFPFTGRGGRWGRFFGPGEVRLALLSLLREGPKHGYELMKALEGRSGGVYRASAGAVYPALQQLADEGMVTSEQAEGKRTYKLTEGWEAGTRKGGGVGSADLAAGRAVGRLAPVDGTGCGRSGASGSRGHEDRFAGCHA
jgi:hypothetical protein